MVRRPLAVEQDHEAVQERVRRQFRLGGLTGNGGQQFGNEVLEQRGGRSVRDGLRYDEKRAPNTSFTQ